MIHLHAIPTEQVEREIVALRSQADACCPPKSLLEAGRYQSLMHKIWGLQDELTRREHEKYRDGRRTRRLKYSWRGNPPKSVAEKLNREADKRLKRALELEAG